jgi:SAM-dependent methyltransferase
MKAYQSIVSAIAKKIRARSILDLPCGTGWLRDELGAEVEIDGVDLYEAHPRGYRKFLTADLEGGVPESFGSYDLIVSCEGIEHIANPGLLLRAAHRHLNDGGTIVITTPNTWHPSSRLKFFYRGFYPGFPRFLETITPGMHLHLTPWNWPQLYLHLTYAGFSNIEMHPCLADQRSSVFERILGLPMKAYCRSKARSAKIEEERRYWETAGSPGAIDTNRLIVSARKK